MITIRDLSVRYGQRMAPFSLARRRNRRPALTAVTLAIPPGVFGLLGPNGAGKSTLLKVLATVLTPTSGDVTVAGYSIRSQPVAVRRLLGYIPQDGGAYPRLRVWDMLNYLAIVSGLDDPALRHERIARALEAVNLTDRARQRAGTLSGGMRQRLNIAQALIHEPRVIIADEPTARLDPGERIRLRALLARAAMERTVILSMHIASDIGAACPSVAVLHQGRVIYSGSTGGLAAQADGRLWETTMPVAATETQWPVSRLTTTSQGTVLRVVAPASRDMGGDITGWQAVTETPSVEEGYLALMGKAVPVL